MKITKILFAALVLTLFSCSQDDTVLKTESSLSTAHLKMNGLSEQEVDSLKIVCAKISTSNEFLTMRKSVKAFCDNINNNENAIFIKDKDFKVWIEKNLKSTNYTTVADGLAGLESSKAACEIYYNANRKFFENLSSGTDSQITDILTPITTEPPYDVDMSIGCVVGCVIKAIPIMKNINLSYQDDLQIDAIEAEYVRDYVATAESHRAAGIETLNKFISDCIGGCVF